MDDTGELWTIEETVRATPPTAEDCRFCFDFVIDSALRLQEFDFDTK
jgi:hypothetical protein